MHDSACGWLEAGTVTEWSLFKWIVQKEAECGIFVDCHGDLDTLKTCCISMKMMFSHLPLVYAMSTSDNILMEFEIVSIV